MAACELLAYLVIVAAGSIACLAGWLTINEPLSAPCFYSG
jgi:hypothetical protein